MDLLALLGSFIAEAARLAWHVTMLFVALILAAVLLVAIYNGPGARMLRGLAPDNGEHELGQ